MRGVAAGVSIALAVACGQPRPDLEVRVETAVAVPNEANLLRAEIDSGADEQTSLELELLESAPRYTFRIEAGARAVEQVRIELALLHDRTTPAARATITVPFPREGRDCVRVFVPRIDSRQPVRLASCSGEYATDPPDTAVPDALNEPDAAIDPDGGLPEDAAANVFPYPPSNVVLEQLLFRGAIDVDGACTFDTTALALSGACGDPTLTPIAILQTNGPELAVLAIESANIREGAALSITGERAAAIIVRGAATIDGEINASATGARDGPGVDRGSCRSLGRTEDDGPEGGGGGGGGFAKSGGRGGDGENGTFPGAQSGGAGGVPALKPLVAGCPGAGAIPDARSDNPSVGGGGGGALQISVAGVFEMRGAILAEGGGGGAGPESSGGGGGGSGGAILLEADQLTISGLIKVNGGGGGGGGSIINPGTIGEDGGNGGGGGVASNNPEHTGGGGGTGATRTSDALAGGTGGSAAGGGGGGGAAGRVRLNARTCLGACT